MLGTARETRAVGGEMFTIGEFSKVTGLTVKTLRFYHEEGLLVPRFVDPQTGYRHYDAGQVDTARVIAYFRRMEFPVAEIRDLLRHLGDEDRLLDAIERHKAVVEARARHLKTIARSLDQFISEERQAIAMARGPYEVQEKVLDPMLVGGVRMRGRYCECGKGFATIGRTMGRSICGMPVLLHYDTEYKDDDADFEACFPIRQSRSAAANGISVRELPGGRCLSLMHEGPYEQLGHAYAKVFGHAKSKGYRVATPTREVYLKGPGMIFKGNPKRYLTEIQVPVEPDGGPGRPPAP